MNIHNTKFSKEMQEKVSDWHKSGIKTPKVDKAIAHQKKTELAKKISAGKNLRDSIVKAHTEGKTSLDYHQSRSLMRHVNKPN